jgi:hypothetical protein
MYGWSGLMLSLQTFVPCFIISITNIAKNAKKYKRNVKNKDQTTSPHDNDNGSDHWATHINIYNIISDKNDLCINMYFCTIFILEFILKYIVFVRIMKIFTKMLSPS